eukprot:scaffold7231_cov153-Pinguiococcus_pyrenoidosus.AAC.1
MAFAVYIGVLALASETVNTNYNDALDGVADGLLTRANRAVGDLAFFSLVSGTVGCAACILGFMHYFSWTLISRRNAIVIGVVALMLNIVAGGYGIRVLELGDDGIANGEDLDDKFQALASLAIAQVVAQLVAVGAALALTTNLNFSPWLSSEGMLDSPARYAPLIVGAVSLLIYLARA